MTHQPGVYVPLRALFLVPIDIEDVLVKFTNSLCKIHQYLKSVELF